MGDMPFIRFAMFIAFVGVGRADVLAAVLATDAEGRSTPPGELLAKTSEVAAADADAG